MPGFALAVAAQLAVRRAVLAARFQPRYLWHRPAHGRDAVEPSFERLGNATIRFAERLAWLS